MNTPPTPNTTPDFPEYTTAQERQVDVLLHHYGLSHVHPTNEHIHMVAIPAIMLSLTGLMFALHPAIALVFFGASMVYYARLSWRFTGCMLLVSSVILAVVDALDARGVLELKVGRNGVTAPAQHISNASALRGALLGFFLAFRDVLSDFTEHWMLFFGPLLVAMDSHGGNLYTEVNKVARNNRAEVLAALGVKGA